MTRDFSLCQYIIMKQCIMARGALVSTRSVGNLSLMLRPENLQSVSPASPRHLRARPCSSLSEMALLENWRAACFSISATVASDNLANPCPLLSFLADGHKNKENICRRIICEHGGGRRKAVLRAVWQGKRCVGVVRRARSALRSGCRGPCLCHSCVLKNRVLELG